MSRRAGGVAGGSSAPPLAASATPADANPPITTSSASASNREVPAAQSLSLPGILMAIVPPWVAMSVINLFQLHRITDTRPRNPCGKDCGCQIILDGIAGYAAP